MPGPTRFRAQRNRRTVRAGRRAPTYGRRVSTPPPISTLGALRASGHVHRGVKAEMKGVLKDIQSGKFARTWIRENKTGKKKYQKLLDKDLAHPIEKVGAELRARMPWLEQSK